MPVGLARLLEALTAILGAINLGGSKEQRNERTLKRLREQRNRILKRIRDLELNQLPKRKK